MQTHAFTLLHSRLRLLNFSYCLHTTWMHQWCDNNNPNWWFLCNKHGLCCKSMCAWYVVFKERWPGVSSNWHRCQAQVKDYPSVSLQKYKNHNEAVWYCNSTINLENYLPCVHSCTQPPISTTKVCSSQIVGIVLIFLFLVSYARWWACVAHATIMFRHGVLVFVELG